MDTQTPAEVLQEVIECPVEAFIHVLSGKWKMLILWRLLDNEKRFSELRNLLPGVTQKVLTQQLRELETDGIVRRDIFAQVPPKVVYALTPLGLSLLPVLKSITLWSKEHMTDVRQARQAIK